MRKEMKSKKYKYNNRRNVNQDEDKNTRIQIANPKIFKLWRKTLSRYQNDILVRRLNFTASSKCNNIVLNSNIKNYTRTLQIVETKQCFSETKKQIILSKIFFKNNLLLPHLETGIKIYVLNDWNLEKMEVKS